MTLVQYTGRDNVQLINRHVVQIINKAIGKVIEVSKTSFSCMEVVVASYTSIVTYSWADGMQHFSSLLYGHLGQL